MTSREYSNGIILIIVWRWESCAYFKNCYIPQIGTMCHYKQIQLIDMSRYLICDEIVNFSSRTYTHLYYTFQLTWDLVDFILSRSKKDSPCDYREGAHIRRAAKEYVCYNHMYNNSWRKKFFGTFLNYEFRKLEFVMTQINTTYYWQICRT